MSRFKLSHTFLIFLFITSCSLEEPVKDFSMDTIAPDKLTIAFYNVENLFDTKNDPFSNDDEFTPNGYKQWDEKRYYEKLKNISKVVNTLNKKDWPIVIGLAEIENEYVLEDLADEIDLKDANYKFVHYDSPDERGIDVAFMYRPEFLHIVKKKYYEINNPEFPNSKTRDILHVEAQFYNGEVFHFFVNHWSSRRSGTKETEPKRVYQARILKKQVNKVIKKDPEAKIIILGDFNDYPEDKSIKEILGAGMSNSDLYNLGYVPHMNDKGTMIHDGDWGVFDQIIVSHNILEKKGLHVKRKQQEILTNDWIIWKGKKPNRTYGGKKYYGGYSDHLPVYIHLEEQKTD